MMGLVNKLRLSMLFATLVALLGGIGYVFFGIGGLVIGLLLGGAMNLVSYYFSDTIVTRMHGARQLDRSEAPDLFATVERLAAEADVPMPELYMMEERTPNAFATGRNPENAVVCVTSGLLHALDSDEVEGVLAHELAHVKNRDTLIQAAAGTIAGAVSMLAQLLLFSTLDDDAGHPAMLLVGVVFAPIAASLVKLAISRSREYTADATAAEFTDPSYLASALRSIESAVNRAPMRNGPQGTSHMFIVNPFRGKRLARLFSTHPPTEERVKRLREQA